MASAPEMQPTANLTPEMETLRRFRKVSSVPEVGMGVPDPRLPDSFTEEDSSGPEDSSSVKSSWSLVSAGDWEKSGRNLGEILEKSQKNQHFQKYRHGKC